MSMPLQKKPFDARDTKRFAAEIRKNCIRALEAAGSGHIGGSMSIADMLAVLYNDILNVDPAQPHWEARDWLVLSKGHCGPALYATLALKGYFDPAELLTLNKGVWNVYKNSDAPLWQCVRCASLNPATLLGIRGRKGSLEVGKDADIIITDEEFNVIKTIIGGTVRYEA